MKMSLKFGALSLYLDLTKFLESGPYSHFPFKEMGAVNTITVASVYDRLP